MRKAGKYVLILFVGIVLFIAFHGKVVEVGLVNSREEAESISVLVDGEIIKTQLLSPSIVPEEFILLDLGLGLHTVEITSENCDAKKLFKFFNVIGYHINVEYYEDTGGMCSALKRESYFGLTYQ